MSSNPSRGFLYCAFGESYLDEAAAAIAMLLRHNVGANVCLVTTDAGKAYYDRTYAHLNLDRIICMSAARDEPRYFFRTKLYDLSPYDKTLALDVDTYTTADIQDLFDLLDTFDFVAVPDEAHPARGAIIGLKGGYAALNYYNAGVLLFRKSPATRQLFDNWTQEFLDLAPLEYEQGPLIRALVKTNIRFITLPQEYNLRLSNKCASFMGRVKIIHGRARHPDKLLRMVNDITLVNRGSRVWMPTLQRVVPATTCYVYGRLLKLLNLDEVQWAGAGSVPRTSVAHNVQDAVRNVWRRLLTKLASGPQGNGAAAQPDLAVLEYLTRTYAIRSFFGCGRGAEVYAKHCADRSIKAQHITPDWRSGPPRADQTFELVWCEETRSIKPRDLRHLIETLTRHAERFLVLTYPRPAARGSRASDFQEDWYWVQLITERGFYFDPHLTLALRGVAQDGDFKHAGLAFERIRRPQG